jgi:hypothetical protein
MKAPWNIIGIWQDGLVNTTLVEWPRAEGTEYEIVLNVNFATVAIPIKDTKRCQTLMNRALAGAEAHVKKLVTASEESYTPHP